VLKRRAAKATAEMQAAEPETVPAAD
jgi:hypothetical protein